MNCLYIIFEYKITKENLFNTSDGIRKKIYSQIKSLENENLNLTVYNPYFSRNPKFNGILRRLPFFQYIKWDDLPINISDIDVIYIRKPWFMDGDLIRNLIKYKRIKPSLKVLMEIPTFPYDKEGKKISYIPLIIKDRRWRNHLRNHVDRIVTYSDDENIFNIKTIRISNGINTSEVFPISKDNFNEHSINMVACSSLYYWHGYDRIIEALRDYYSKPRTNIVYFHVVGDGDQMNKYLKLVKKYNLQQYVLFHGRLSGVGLNQVYEKSDIAIDSLGRHRSGVYFNSSLKGKEYLAKGLPIVSGVKTELDKDRNFIYYMRIPADDTIPSIEEICGFCKKVYYKKSRKLIISLIHDYAVSNFSYNEVMKPVIDYIKE